MHDSYAELLQIVSAAFERPLLDGYAESDAIDCAARIVAIVCRHERMYAVDSDVLGVDLAEDSRFVSLGAASVVDSVVRASRAFVASVRPDKRRLDLDSVACDVGEHIAPISRRVRKLEFAAHVRTELRHFGGNKGDCNKT